MYIAFEDNYIQMKVFVSPLDDIIIILSENLNVIYLKRKVIFIVCLDYWKSLNKIFHYMLLGKTAHCQLNAIIAG